MVLKKSDFALILGIISLEVHTTLTGNPCRPNPCENGGTCTSAGEDSFSCRCAVGYTGEICDTEVTACTCTSNPCRHDGTCSDGPNSYSCQCASGYTGINCQTDIDDCLNATCLNDGSCIDGINNYTCQCTALYTGTYCETVATTEIDMSTTVAGYQNATTTIQNTTMDEASTGFFNNPRNVVIVSTILGAAGIGAIVAIVYMLCQNGGKAVSSPPGRHSTIQPDIHSRS